MRSNQSTIVVTYLLSAILLAACGGGGGGTPDATPMPDQAPPPPDAIPSASPAIQEARDAVDGVVSIDIVAVTVTYVRPGVGNDPTGFFVQDDQMGPALFVAVDPGTLSPVPRAGDEVTFTVTNMATSGSARQADAIASFAQVSTGNDISGLLQDLSAATDLVTGLDTYESEYITMSATITGPFGFAGTAHSSANIDTAGMTADPDFKLRLPNTLLDALNLVDTCVVAVNTGIMWRFNAGAQPSVWVAQDVTVTSCPAPQVTFAAAGEATTVRITFDRNIDPATIMGDGSQFTFDNNLTASAATAAGSNAVDVITSAQVAGTAYTVTVAASITDTLGAGIDSAANTATFVGFLLPINLINEIDYDNVGADGAEFVELFNGTAIPLSLDGVALVLVNGNGGAEYNRTVLSGVIAPGEYVVIARTTATLTLPGGTRRIDMLSSIQNGGPDGVALIDVNNSVLLDALSYEGSITAATINGFTGTVSLVEGTAATAADSGSIQGSMSRIPNGSDTDDADTDWVFVTTPTPGAANAP